MNIKFNDRKYNKTRNNEVTKCFKNKMENQGASIGQQTTCP